MSKLSTDVERLRRSLPETPAPVARPVLVLISGLPGSGKSYFSRNLVAQVPLLVLESDALRQALVGNPSYSGPESARLFDACHALIGDLLGEGSSILFDATNLIEDHRKRLYAIADQGCAKTVICHVTAPPGVIRERLKDRSRRLGHGDRSSADWDVYRKMFSTVEPIKRNHFVVDTSRDISPAVSKVVRVIKAWIRGPLVKI